jgi:putative hydrolase of the HAD superfamily
MRWLIWDFDGTLGYREGGWSGALEEVLHRAYPAHPARRADLKANLHEGFPWHTYQYPHPNLDEADRWWARLQPVFERAFRAVGLKAASARYLAGQVRETYLEPRRWRLFDDSIPALQRLAGQGWRHVLLSNHVPELEVILARLGIRPWLEQVWNSARTGYEKPHPEAFRQVLAALLPADAIWMIGDNAHSDITGAAGVGIPGILVRRPHPGVQHFCASLDQLDLELSGGGGSPGAAD